MEKLKKEINEILNVAGSENPWSRVFNVFIMSLISLNVVAVMLETVESLAAGFPAFFKYFDLFSVMVFTLEYLLRIWTITENKDYGSPVAGRIKFLFTPLALVDIIAILPFYLPMLIPIDLRFVRALRLARLMRILKLGRYSESLRMMGRVIKAKREELFITVFVVFLLIIMSSSLMFYIENLAQPKVFSSIPAAMWWSVATLTTVGYGDMYPVTIAGKILGSVIALLGIGIFALPAGILGSGFVEEMHRKTEKKKVCPHCGKEIIDG